MAAWAGGRSSHAPSSSSSSPKAFLRFLRRLVPFGWSQSVSLSVRPPPKITSRYWYLYSSHRAWARPGLFWRENVPRSYLLQPTELNIRPVNGIWNIVSLQTNSSFLLDAERPISTSYRHLVIPFFLRKENKARARPTRNSTCCGCWVQTGSPGQWKDQGTLMFMFMLISFFKCDGL